MGIAFQFYNADLIDICDKKNGEGAVAFIDDTLLLAHGKNLKTTNTKVVMSRNTHVTLLTNLSQF